jgi:hypothetical protein
MMVPSLHATGLRRRVRVLAVGLVIWLAALGGSAAQADFQFDSVTLTPFGVRQGSCPTTTFCIVPDSQGSVHVSTNPAAGATSTWASKAIEPGSDIQGVSCAGTALCVAVDSNGNAITSTDAASGASATWSSPFAIDAGFSLNGVACPSTTLCVAVDGSGRVVTSTNPTGGSVAWTRGSITGAGGLYQVSCPSTSLCVAVDGLGNALSSTNPAGGNTTWNANSIDGSTPLFSVQCQSGTLCLAGDQTGHVLVSTSPSLVGPAWPSTDLDLSSTSNSVFGVACPSTTLCVAVDNAGTFWTTTAPTSPTPGWTGLATGAGSFNGLMCPSTTLCVGPAGGAAVIATPAKPTVVTGGATAITATGATVHGTVNPHGFTVTDCHFEAGTTTSYGFSVPCAETVGGGSGGVPVSASYGSLPSNTTIDYRLVATNANGTVLGSNATFTTLTAATQITNTARPAISGTPLTGSQLSCTNGSWTNNPTTFSITWERGLRSATSDTDPSWHAIAGASGSTYVVQSADDGSRVRCHVVASSGSVSGEASSTSLRTDAGIPTLSTAPGSAAPSISGTPIQGNTLTCNPGSWDNSPSFTYQWTRSGLGAIPGATGPTYTLTRYRDDTGHVVDPNGDGNHTIACQITGTNDLGSSAPVSVGGVLAIDGTPFPLDYPHIDVARDAPSDSNPLKQTFTCSPGRWYDDYSAPGADPYRYTFEWSRNGAIIAGATDQHYRPVSADYGRQLSCRATVYNPAGHTTTTSNLVLVALPTGTTDTAIYREGGTNQVDPTNLLAISGEYISAVRSVVIDRLNKGIGDITSACQDEITAHHWAQSSPGLVLTIPDEQTRCRILVYEKDRVQPVFDGGVRFRNDHCTAVPDAVSPDFPLCPSLDIQVAPIDPLRPPAQDAELLARIADKTPSKILWDLDGNGTTDAVCPGDAPVLRTILGFDRNWHPRAVILDQSDQPAHFGDLPFALSNAKTTPTQAGVLRDTQVKVCATSFDPPPDKELPCVTSGDIGRIHFSNANLCPISARDINPDDFKDLLTGDAQGYLAAVAEQDLAGTGHAALRSVSGGAIHTTWVRWDNTPQRPQAAAVRTASGRILDAPFQKYAGAALENTAAALTARLSPDHFVAAPAALDKFTALVKKLTFNYNADNGGFAYNQIYVARGVARAGARSLSAGGIAGSITGGSLDINGVTMNAVGDTAALLVPSDIGSALPNVHDMSLVGRDVASQLGPAIHGQGIPLAIGGPLKTTLSDNVKGAQEELLRQTNLSDMVAKAPSQAAADALRKALDIAPFNFLGDSQVTVTNDGSATLHAQAELPGLNGPDPKDKIVAAVTLHAALDGRISIDDIHLHAEKAFLGGITLSGVDVTYGHNTGVAITGKILFPQLAGQGVDIKRFALGPDGAFQELNLDYLAGAGSGIPLGQGVFLTTLGADINVAADVFGAHVVVSAGASTGAGCPSLGADGTMTIKLARPFSLDAKVDLLLSCLRLAQLHFAVDQTGSVQVDGKTDLNAGPIYLHADAGGKFHYPDWQVWADGDGGITGVLTGQVHAVISNLGLAGCGSLGIRVPLASDIVSFFTGDSGVIHVSGGASVDFIKGRPPLNELEIINNLSLFTGCDIGRYYSLGHRSLGRQAASGSSAFIVPPKAGASLFSIEGAGAAPHVVLHSPSGKTYDFTDATGPNGKSLPNDAAWGTVLDTEDRTVVIVPRPEAGTWTAETAPGSPAVSRVRRAPILPPAVMKAHVSGRGAHRTLTYAILPQAGQTVIFRETAPGGLKVLKTIQRGGKGSFRYTVGDATGSQRVVEADIFLNGRPRRRVIVAHYVANSPPVGKANHIHVSRVGNGAFITWRQAAQASKYLLSITYGRGMTIILQPKPWSLRAVVPGLHKGEGLRIKIYADSPSGRRGPAAKAALKGSMVFGSIKKLPPIKHHKPKKKH